MKKNKSQTILASTLCLLTSGVNAALLEEVIVTAQKREQNIQDVGIAITAFSGDQIDQLGWNNAEQLAAQTPGLVATSYEGSGTISLFSIRGVAQTDFNDHQEAPTVVYMDGVYLPQTSAAGAAMFDVDRVEVLKGPQGTLYGRNATGGLVHIISRRPTEDLEGSVEAELSDYQTTRFTGIVSGPLSDNLQGRLSVLKQDSDGYFSNDQGGPDLREVDSTHIRAQLQSDVSDKLSVWGSLSWGEADYGAAAYRHRVASLDENGLGFFGGAETDFGGYVNNGDFYSGDFNDAGGNDASGWMGMFNLEYEINDGLKFVSITSFQNNEKEYTEDSDSSPASFAHFTTEQDVDDITQEFRLDGSSDSLSWTAGLYYINIDGDYRVNFQFPDYFGYSTFPDNFYSQETESWAIFGQAEFQLTDTLSMVTGLRWTTDEKDFSTNVVCVDTSPLAGCEDFGLQQGAVQPLPTVVDLSPLDLDRSDDDVTGKIQLDWRPTDDLLIYAGFNRGMKAGGFLGSIDGGATLPDLSFDPEILHSYEVGFKSTMMDGRVRLNGAAFYYDYSDYQAFVFQGITSVIQNHDATIAGAELELVMLPAEGLEILFGISALDATVEDIDLGNGTIKDQNMTLAPELTVNFLGRKEWLLSTGGAIALQVDGLYVSEQEFNSINSEAAGNDAYDIWNARLSYQPNEHWTAEVFVNNLADEEYWTYGFDLALFFGSAIIAVGEPRWIGASVKYSF